MAKLRLDDFRIGTYHGKLLPEDDKREYAIQRQLYLIGNMVLQFSKSKNTEVRLFAYEFPLDRISRGKSIDLIGYDKEFNIYIFEVKRENNTEPLSKVVDQVEEYGIRLRNKLTHIENEFKKVFLVNGVNFRKGKIHKIILAPREYRGYKYKEYKSIKPNDDVLFGYFARIKKGRETTLLKSCKGKVYISFYKNRL